MEWEKCRIIYDLYIPGVSKYLGKWVQVPFFYGVMSHFLRNRNTSPVGLVRADADECSTNPSALMSGRRGVVWGGIVSSFDDPFSIGKFNFNQKLRKLSARHVS